MNKPKTRRLQKGKGADAPVGQLWCSYCKDYHAIDQFANNSKLPQRGGKDYACKYGKFLENQVRKIDVMSPEELTEARRRAEAVIEIIDLIEEN